MNGPTASSDSCAASPELSLVVPAVLLLAAVSSERLSSFLTEVGAGARGRRDAGNVGDRDEEVAGRRGGRV